MSEVLRIALIQPDIYWKGIARNQEQYEVSFSQLRECDLIILPEMCLTGFISDPGSIADAQDDVLRWLKSVTAEKNAFLICSHPVRESGRYFNRLFFAGPEGEWQHYDKRHLFSLGGEKDNYAPGQKTMLAEVRGWKLMPLVCYDLRFPVWSRNTADYDLLIYIANWPAARKQVWETLLRARAIENQCYVAGVNRVGRDDNNIDYEGLSMVVSPDGSILQSLEGRVGVAELSLKMKDLQSFRKRFPFLRDRDDFILK